MRLALLYILLFLWAAPAMVARGQASDEPGAPAGNGAFADSDEPGAPAGNGASSDTDDPGTPAGNRAFVELATKRSAYYVQEPVRVILRFGLDADFFDKHAIQLFRRKLDAPVQIQAGWLEDLPGALILEGRGVRSGAESQARQCTFALNDGVGKAVQKEDRIMAGQRFTVLEMEASFLPLRPGELTIPGPDLHFAFAGRFEDDLITGPVPVDRQDVNLSGPSLTLTILTLPRVGRPHGFTGAVGRFTVEGSAAPKELVAGGNLKLVLRIEGEGNLAFFDPPVLDRLEGFHVYGSLDRKGRAQRIITYDLAPLSHEVSAVPPISFVYFDPEPPAGYHEMKTRPISIEVQPLPEGARLEQLQGVTGGRVPGITDIHGLMPLAGMTELERRDSLSPALVVGVLGAPWLLALGLLLRLRACERDRRDPAGVRARKAAAVFRVNVGEPGMDPAAAFAEFLAARMRCPAAAVIDPNLEARLTNAGLPTDLAVRAADLLKGLVGANYGSSVKGEETTHLLHLVNEIEAAFVAGEEQP